jgi:acetyl esterase
MKFFAICLSLLLLSPSFATAQRKRPPLPEATFTDVSYGPHERHVIDYYKAESSTPTPLAVYIHGGGFTSGNKQTLNAGTLKQLRDAGISVAAINYRYSTIKPLPAAHHDARHALQFMRSKAGEWGFDKNRIGAFGGSAGAQICMYLAFHDEMADPGSNDPVARESTRLACVATSGGQTTMNFEWWRRWIPGYETNHRDFKASSGVATYDELRRAVRAFSALDLISADDPPIFMSYGMTPDAPIPEDPKKANGWKIHHVTFGVKLKERMDALGVAADLKYPGAITTYQNTAEFFIRQFGK